MEDPTDIPIAPIVLQQRNISVSAKIDAAYSVRVPSAKQLDRGDFRASLLARSDRVSTAVAGLFAYQFIASEHNSALRTATR